MAEAIRSLATALVLALATGACGLKGDLYIPAEPEPASRAEAPPQTEPASESSTQTPTEEEADIE